MTLCRASAALIALFVFQAPSLAQTEDRYVLEKTDGGFVRMDRRTGEMSICEERSGQLVCKLAADERLAIDDEIDRLQETVSTLEERVAALEGAAPAVKLPQLPTEQEFEQTLGFMERFFRRFVDVMKDLDSDAPANPRHAPDRT